MGMLDYIKIEVPLPDRFKDDYFQTKCFDKNLDNLKFTCKGVFHPLYDSPRKIHGVISFYTTEGEVNSENWIWHEYFAKFTDGKVEWIKKKINLKW